LNNLINYGNGYFNVKKWEITMMYIY
jgi:hypothetical protein